LFFFHLKHIYPSAFNAGSDAFSKNTFNAWCGCRFETVFPIRISTNCVLPGAGAMKCLLLLNLSFLVSNVATLGITLQPQTIVGSPTLVLWTREASDAPDFSFDLRFVQGPTDVGLALANLEMTTDDQFGSASVLFPSAGTYVLKAVTGSPRNTVIGTSKDVAAMAMNSTSTPPPASSTTASSTATACVASSTSSPSSTPSSPASTGSSSLSRIRQSQNIPAIVGGVIGALLILALFAILFVFLNRRRAALRKRLTFHRDMMVQRRSPEPIPSFQSETQISEPTPPTPPPHDVEQGLPISIPRPHASGHIVPSPQGPRPSIRRTEHTTITARPPPESAPLRTRRQKDIADRIMMLRGQMIEVQDQQEQQPESAHILEEMQREMVWLQDHEHSAWAMGLTDVLPPGHSRYMTP